jgi:hypothetical protein
MLDSSDHGKASTPLVVPPSRASAYEDQHRDEKSDGATTAEHRADRANQSDAGAAWIEPTSDALLPLRRLVEVEATPLDEPLRREHLDEPNAEREDAPRHHPDPCEPPVEQRWTERRDEDSDDRPTGPAPPHSTTVQEEA